MRRAQDGDQTAYGLVLRAMLPAIRAFARCRITDETLVEDAIQDTLLTIHKLRHTYDPSLPMLPWIAAIAGARAVDVAKQPVSYGIGGATLVLLLAGYGVGRLPIAKSVTVYLETVLLSITAFLLMVPTVSETLRRVPDGHPFVTDLKSPVLLGAQGALFVALIAGVVAQIIYLRRSSVRSL